MSNTLKNIYSVNFGSAVTVLPAFAAEKIISGQATLTDVRALTALLSLPDGVDRTAKAVSELTGISEDVCESSLAFWRGTGVISVSEAKSKASEQTPSVAPETAENAEKAAPAPEKTEKKLLSNEMPKYSGLHLKALLCAIKVHNL